MIHYRNEPLWYHNGEIQCQNSGCYVNNNNKHKHWSHGSVEYSMYEVCHEIYYSNAFTAVIQLHSLS